MVPDWRSTRKKIELVERHCEICAKCHKALKDSPVGKYLMCDDGDRLVADVYRDVYERQMELGRIRRQRKLGRVEPRTLQQQ